jgi:glycerophosphoryl diester phosphodiesterase
VGVVTGVAAVLLAGAPAAHATTAKPDPCRAQSFVAHRLGNDGTYTENSLSALHRSASDGVLCVELDVRTSRSDSLYVMHDPRVGRTTECTGLVARRTTAQLDACDLDDVDPAVDTGVPRVRQVLAYAAQHQLVPFLDIKEMTSVSWQRLARMVSQLGLDAPGRIVVQGTVSIAPTIKAVLPQAFIAVTLDAAPYGPVPADVATRYDAVSSNFPYVTAEDVQAVHALGRSYFGWTPDTAEAWLACRDLGLDEVFTNDPTDYRTWAGV